MPGLALAGKQGTAPHNSAALHTPHHSTACSSALLAAIDRALAAQAVATEGAQLAVEICVPLALRQSPAAKCAACSTPRVSLVQTYGRGRWEGRGGKGSWGHTALVRRGWEVHAWPMQPHRNRTLQQAILPNAAPPPLSALSSLPRTDLSCHVRSAIGQVERVRHISFPCICGQA